MPIIVHDFKSKYKAFAELTGPVMGSLFKTVRVEQWNTCSPNGKSDELWLSLDRFENKSVYVKPSDELAALIAELSIYGDPIYKDVYLKATQYGTGEYVLAFTFQQILGGYTLIELTKEQYTELNNLV
tara:strand:- start:80 stop:463 length:384 start_codon:yes stop_codon:yes gene_type:complete